MYDIELVSFEERAAALRHIRETVFIEEQGVPRDMEWDADDATALHALAVTRAGEGTDAVPGTPVGTGRLLTDGHIGRMAVLAEWRGKGVGSALLRTLIDCARERGFPRVELSAQTRAIDFYVRHGFEADGPVYMEAGIPHRRMRLEL